MGIIKNVLKNADPRYLATHSSSEIATGLCDELKFLGIDPITMIFIETYAHHYIQDLLMEVI